MARDVLILPLRALFKSLVFVTEGGVNELCDDASLLELVRLLPLRSFAGEGALSDPDGDKESLMLVTRPTLPGPFICPGRCRFGREYEGESALVAMLKSICTLLTPFGLLGNPVLYAVGREFAFEFEF